MLTIRRASKTTSTNVFYASRRVVSTLIISSVVIGLSGCGQKGDLYLANADSQTSQTSSAMLDSTSNPQDAAFAGINDDNVNETSDMQKNQNFELPEPSSDPNDY